MNQLIHCAASAAHTCPTASCCGPCAAIALAKAEEEIVRLRTALELAYAEARQDPLTGALNRKGLEDVIARETARLQRKDGNLCVALLDIDDFKQLNDTLGHLAGDEALKHVTRIIRENTRPQDAVCRYGGEEFLILLPDTNGNHGVNSIRRLQHALSTQGFVYQGRLLTLTFSAGVVEMSASEPVQTAITRADRLMYQAKNTGKNRVRRG